MEASIDSDVLIIGGGPAGCSCALYTSRSSLSTVILDKNPSAGALAITHKIANYPGTPARLSGAQLLEQMRSQAVEYGTEYRKTQVYGVSLEGDKKLVYTPDGCFGCRALVLATGAMGRSSLVKGEDTFLGRGVSYCATCDGAFYKQKEVAVYGENQEAIDEAIHLSKFASKIHWITARPPKQNLSGLEHLEGLAQIQHWKRSKIDEVIGDETGVTSVSIKSKTDSQLTELPLEGVFIYSSGSKPITDYLHDQLSLTDEGGVEVDANMMTSIPGVWAIGDIRNTPYKQAVVACSDGCIAAMSIDKYLNQRQGILVDWVHQ